MLTLFRHYRRLLSSLSVALMLFVSLFSVSVRAAVVGTDSLVEEQALRHKVEMVLEQEVVKQHLSEMGVSESMISERLEHMTTEEMTQLAQAWDETPAGGDFVGLLAFLFIVFVVTDALCATDLFTFVNCMQPKSTGNAHSGSRY